MPTRNVIYLRHGGQVVASQTDLEVASVRMPRNGRVRSVHVWCRALAGTVTVDVWKNGATILTADVTPTAGSHIAGALDGTKTAFAEGDELQLIITTAGASSLDDGAVTIDIG